MKSLFNIILATLLLSACVTRKEVHSVQTANLPLEAASTESQKALDLIHPYTQGMAKAMNEVIGFCPYFLEKKKPSSALGSMMSDAVLEAAQASIPQYNSTTPAPLTLCVLNYGGIRSTLDSGDITIGEVFQIMPFENEIVVLKLPSNYIDTLRTFIQDKRGEPMSKVDKAVLKRSEENKNAYFYLITNDYMANGGDNYAFLTQAEERITTGIKIRDALITYIKGHNPLPLDYSVRNL